MKLTPERYELISHGLTRRCGDWTFRAFSVNHDVNEPLGFIIEHPDLGKVLFVTDTYILPHDLSNWDFDVIMMEANYCKELAEQRRKRADGTKFVEKRRISEHMSFQTAILTLERLNAQRSKTIVLTHLSDGLTDAKRFQSECVAKFGVKTVIADKGVSINLKGY